MKGRGRLPIITPVYAGRRRPGVKEPLIAVLVLVTLAALWLAVTQ